MKCEELFHRYEGIVDGKAKTSPIYCEEDATVTFDRGEHTPYPTCNGPIQVCPKHAEHEQMMLDLHIGLANGTIRLD